MLDGALSDNITLATEGGTLVVIWTNFGPATNMNDQVNATLEQFDESGKLPVFNPSSQCRECLPSKLNVSLSKIWHRRARKVSAAGLTRNKGHILIGHPILLH